MMKLHDLLFFLLAFVSEIVGTVSGFGSSTFFIPFAQFLENYKLVLALSAMLHIFSNFSKISHFNKHIRIKKILLFVIPSVLMTYLGAILNDDVNSLLIQKLIGLVLIFISVLFFIIKIKQIRFNDLSKIILIAASGFFTGLTGTGGAIRGLALSTMSLSPQAFIVLSSTIDIGGDIFRLFVYLKNGYMDWQQWLYIPLLAASAYFGTFIGKIIINKISQQLFEKIVLVFVFISGFAMLFA